MSRRLNNSDELDNQLVVDLTTSLPRKKLSLLGYLISWSILAGAALVVLWLFVVAAFS